MTFCNQHCSCHKEIFEFLHKWSCTKFGLHNLNLEAYKTYCLFVVAQLYRWLINSNRKAPTSEPTQVKATKYY